VLLILFLKMERRKKQKREILKPLSIEAKSVPCEGFIFAYVSDTCSGRQAGKTAVRRLNKGLPRKDFPQDGGRYQTLWSGSFVVQAKTVA
jgi:hypothetical protein